VKGKKKMNSVTKTTLFLALSFFKKIIVNEMTLFGTKCVISFK
jgi:hypothetical protein